MKHIKISLHISLSIEQIFRQVFAKQSAFVKKKKMFYLYLKRNRSISVRHFFVKYNYLFLSYSTCLYVILSPLINERMI